jgi:hypothetical protein
LLDLLEKQTLLLASPAQQVSQFTHASDTPQTTDA